MTKTSALARLNVKLTVGVKPHQSEEVLSSTPGVVSVIQTFPDETDEELARMYVVEVDPAKIKGALKDLEDNPKVESAEPTASRKLIR